MLSKKFALLLGAALLPAFVPTAVRAAEAAADPASAATQTQTAAADPGVHDDAHPQAGDDIIVTAPFARDRFGLLTGVSVLDGATLTREKRGTIGETLTSQAGVSATYFGPNASRPILRGFQGERVRVLTDGIGSFDVSNTSVDHAVVINPLLAERIEVLHGPTSLLYGSSAIGGIVNVIDTRIPRSVPTEPVHIEAMGDYGTAANEFNGSAIVDIPLTPNLVLHFDGSYLNADDMKIGGYVLSEPLREAAIANGAFDVAALKDSIPNTAAETWNVAGGLAFVGDSGNAGIAISRYSNTYGVPIRYSTDPAVEAEAVTIAMEQTRVDARAEFETGRGFVEQIKLRYGFADYQHSEIEEDGTIGTSFYNRGMEARVEFVQAQRGVWKGAFGAQLVTRNVDVIGAEAFLPRNSTTQIGAFLLEEATFGIVKAELGARIENSQVSAAMTGFNRSFTPLSASIGASVPLGGDDWRIGLDFAHTERAPSAEELLADGPHGGTQAYEIGDPDFGIERSNGAELVLRGKGRGFTLEASAFYDQFSNFIYAQDTGAIIDDLPVYQALQADATYWGFEIQGTVTVADIGSWTLTANALADYVNAEIDSVGPAPRIPPFRVRGGVDFGNDAVTLQAEIEVGAAQNRVATFETTTPGYTLVNASATWTPWTDRPGTYFIFAVNNILDADARRAASFLKDYAPVPGRDFRLSFRVAI
jgi:iron complex outermembrane receptor protein